MRKYLIFHNNIYIVNNINNFYYINNLEFFFLNTGFHREIKRKAKYWGLI